MCNWKTTSQWGFQNIFKMVVCFIIIKINLRFLEGFWTQPVGGSWIDSGMFSHVLRRSAHVRKATMYTYLKSSKCTISWEARRVNFRKYVFYCLTLKNEIWRVFNFKNYVWLCFMLWVLILRFWFCDY